jgi:phospholipase/carboxylesterase
MTKLSFIHRFEPGGRPEAPPLLLLHGTGGDENDLVSLGRTIAPASALLSPRGKVLEHGMPRFFRRLAEGVFDEDDLKTRARELADFIGTARERYGIAAPVALGYSNGANIAAAVMLLRPETLAGGILLRAMVPLSKPPEANLKNMPVLIVSAVHDPIVPQENGARLAALLAARGAGVDRNLVAAGHELTPADVEIARGWLEEHAAALSHQRSALT